MMVENVDYDSLAANETLMDSFKLACAEAIATQAGQGISASDVEVTVIDGSVIVEGLIKVPDGISVSTVSDNLASFDSLADAVVQGVLAVPGIANVQTGEIGVIQTTTTVLGSNQADDANSAGLGGIFLIVLAVICVGGVCGGMLAQISRRGPRGATPIEVFGNSPRSSSCKVTERLKLSEHTEGGRTRVAPGPAMPGGTRKPCPPGDLPSMLFEKRFTGAQSALRSAASQPESGTLQDLVVTSETEDPNGTDNKPPSGGTGSTVDGVAHDSSGDHFPVPPR